MYVYGQAGNLKSKIENGNITTWYFYNAQNKLVKIKGNDFVYEFLYDSQNRRIAIGEGADESSLIWRKIIHEGNIPIIETDCTNVIEKIFVRGLGIAEGTGDVIAELTTGNGLRTTFFYLANHRGDTILVLNSGGAVENYFCYDAFGNQTHMQNETGFKPKYTFSTKEFLPSAELYLYAYRVYDPISGRWTQRDPIDYQDSINLYQFCANNPIIIYDEFGLLTLKIGTGVGGSMPGAGLAGNVWVGIFISSKGIGVTGTASGGGTVGIGSVRAPIIKLSARDPEAGVSKGGGLSFTGGAGPWGGGSVSMDSNAELDGELQFGLGAGGSVDITLDVTYNKYFVEFKPLPLPDATYSQESRNTITSIRYHPKSNKKTKKQ